MRWGTSKVNYKQTGEWHEWYAWRPVKCEDKTWVWLEYVERRWIRVNSLPFGSEWRYRVKPALVNGYQPVIVKDRAPGEYDGV